jgi:hypothetical protein
VARALRVAQFSLVALLVPVMVCVATGWLYLMRGHMPMPGPRMPEALPLDELPGHASVPLLPFIVAWGAAGLTLGCAARAARVRLRVIAPLFGLASGALLAAATWLSIYVVRQIPSGEAFHAALAAPAVYSAAALVTLGALLPVRSADHHGLKLGQPLEGVAAAHAAGAAVGARAPAKRQVVLPVVRRLVDVHEAGANAVRVPQPGHHVASEDRGE